MDKTHQPAHTYDRLDRLDCDYSYSPHSFRITGSSPLTSDDETQPAAKTGAATGQQAGKQITSRECKVQNKTVSQSKTVSQTFKHWWYTQAAVVSEINHLRGCGCKPPFTYIAVCEGLQHWALGPSVALPTCRLFIECTCV